MLRWTGKFAALIVALSLWGTPLIDCMLRADALTEIERECCQEMADQCGSSAMPTSHSCCQEVPQSGSGSFLIVKIKSPAADAGQTFLNLDTLPATLPHAVLSPAPNLPLPLKSPPGISTILRI